MKSSPTRSPIATGSIAASSKTIVETKFSREKVETRSSTLERLGQYLGMLLQNYLICARFKFNELPPLE
jgi:hypothetical protein